MRVVVVEEGRVESTVTNSKAGTVRARRRSRLSPEIGGRVVEILHREGDVVEEGALLIRLADDSQLAQLEHAKRSLAAAKARHEQLCLTAERNRREFERNKKLADERVISIDLLDEFESRYSVAVLACNAAEADVETARAAILVSEAELAKTKLFAPFRGVIAEIPVEVGEWITPSPPMMQAPSVLDLIDPESIYVSAPMDEVDSAAILKGQPVRITIDPFPDQEFPGRVVRVAPFVLDLEEQNRTVEIEVELDDATFAATLLPGTSADVEVLLEVRAGKLRIPTGALLRDDFVLVVREGVLVRQKVDAGLRNWAFAEIRDGLEPGDRVVTSLDRAEARAGARVRVEEEETER